MIVRYAIAGAVGTAVTCALLFLMQLMIHTGQDAITGACSVSMADFVRVERSPRVETKEQARKAAAARDTPGSARAGCEPSLRGGSGGILTFP